MPYHVVHVCAALTVNPLCFDRFTFGMYSLARKAVVASASKVTWFTYQLLICARRNSYLPSSAVSTDPSVADTALAGTESCMSLVAAAVPPTVASVDIADAPC